MNDELVEALSEIASLEADNTRLIIANAEVAKLNADLQTQLFTKDAEIVRLRDMIGGARYLLQDLLINRDKLCDAIEKLTP